ncbi:hypothetical protein R3P38DRAFT_3581449 [Favolaschia claudopus]|uniref:Uncharacterized protein n=1 Tax=Favolaschia claudopus TaxID=2862362 RepID=A0AAW0AJM7_9AGAR
MLWVHTSTSLYHFERHESVPSTLSYDIWTDLRTSDPVPSTKILEALGPFMKAQTDAFRMQENIGLRAYLAWRNFDIGGPLITATGLYCIDTQLVLPPTDLAVTNQLHEMYMKHIIYGNDAWSYDKELKTAQETAAAEEVNPATPVQAFSSISAGITARSAKRLLVFLQREMEVLFEEAVRGVLCQKGRDPLEMRRFIKMLEYQMSGSELWATETLRYYDSAAV